jgi:hypothetical protein
MTNVKVLLTGDITGARDGAAWPPAGSVIELPEDEAQSLVHSGMAKSVDGSEATAKLAEAASTVLDAVTSAQVRNATTTRERQSVSKRAHEPINLGVAADEQPDELDNGPRLAEVNAEDSAKVEDPKQQTQSEDGPTGATKPPTGGENDTVEVPAQPKATSPEAAKSGAKAGGGK